jgi:hypothetical protein
MADGNEPADDWPHVGQNRTKTAGDRSEAREATQEPLPEAVQEAATRLTRHARATGDSAAEERYRAERESLLAEHDYTARVREADATLVLHPGEWVDDGTVRVDRIEDTDDAVEISLEAPDEDWTVVERHNRRVVDRVADEHGEVHAANVRVLADYAGNHLERRIEHLSDDQIDRFLAEYAVRNAWPSDEQRAVLTESVAIAREVAEKLGE